MSNNSIIQTDILVMGAGLAGIMAAISAAEAGAEVTLVSSGATCSGSSFYPGTWGFGLVGPENQEDEEELIQTILAIGEGVADPELVRVFVPRINDSIAYLESLGVPLKKADHPGEREFIPCFDHKGRSWHGIIKEEARPVFLVRLKELGVKLMPHTEITGLLPASAGQPCRITGAVAVQEGQRFVEFSFGAMIIASGGLGGLYRYRLNPGDVTGMGQYLALTAGAKLVNIEFMQMMPGFLSPAYGTVFNEKIFRYTRSPAFDAWSDGERDELLELRSGHGPYTSRLKSGRVDEALSAAWAKEPEGVLVSYDPVLKEHQPEFVRTYFEWLEREKHLTPDDPVRLGIFAHASNGGIRIDKDGFTGVPGLYACGEATGGMHGADRLGGLSTANGLVFGRLAGAAAAREIQIQELSRKGETQECAATQEVKTVQTVQTAQTAQTVQTAPASQPLQSRLLQSREAVQAIRQELQTRMSFCAMIGRSEAHCQELLSWLEHQSGQPGIEPSAADSPSLYLEKCRLKAGLTLSACMMEAIRQRKESRGSHHREDYPEKDEAGQI